MEKYELPLVIFTVLSQMSVGMTLLLTWRTLRGEVHGTRLHWLITGLILGVASIAAVLHLAHPEHAYNALINLKHAWLSREILGATLYGAMIGLAFLSKGNKGAALLASLFGILLVVVQGMTYAAPAMQAIANGITMMLFFATVWVMGCAATPLLGLKGSNAALRQGIIALMALLIAAPVMWLSGGTIMKMTAHAWLSSPLYLGSLLCCVVGGALSLKRQPMQKAVFALLLVGVVLSRLTFFGDTISTIVNIGHLY
ncbi:dimethyl sulfoxide reductase anchor subunit [Enterobacter bugandensis]|jgi:DMSO reductase anchor subunit|uniref:Hydrogenase n=2 Tax=Enterobacteriaceae TaxID=543 RepID=A0ABX4VGI4_9ENTR|nr:MULTISPECIES: DmsC/YnfH family molybdoenzyme membrane anchor subunit [Enterobacter]MBE3535872.1 dimethyl sulfoxide reductase anchor subunit [Enterobacter cloacae complex sp. I3]ELF8872330.1 dimethyl sulfoxide reductase anchor subunit [Enterobacter bugandensis]ELQ3994190.1 dimethyl sulfoxide reductase anchor subunit [Enterobacter bugandensis]ELV3040304.1 dimethyl sulfoxide reductase anchor subunit [Enterobacter bugandensis]ELX8413065.1 dimethyl sulfoxide reductase anchor subunit [Enterobacte